MLTVRLDREDLIYMIKGVPMSYKRMDIPEVKDNGTFSASYGRWDWSYGAFSDVNTYTESVLWDLYHMLKTS